MINIADITTQIYTELQTLCWTDPSKRFSECFPYVNDEPEKIPTLYFVLEDWWSNILDSSENSVSLTYWFYIIRNYDTTDRFNTELAIQKDFQEIFSLFVNKIEVFNNVYKIDVDNFYIDDKVVWKWKAKVWALFLNFHYVVDAY
jgi:hypothetical protein